MPGRIRDATEDDAAACAAVDAPSVVGTTVSFEDEPPSAEEMGRRIALARQSHAWLVLEEDGEVVGYAYAAPVKERAAYRWSCEVSVYLARGRSGAGRGRALEVNTASPLASVDQVRWFYEEGGEAVSFGSDAHGGVAVGQRFDVAVDVVEAAGFRPGRDRFDFWRR